MYHHMYQVWIHPELQVDNRLGLSKYPSSEPSYAPIVNSYRAPGEEQFGALQEERRATIEQVKSLENIIA